jgi:hypothetical protein
VELRRGTFRRVVLTRVADGLAALHDNAALDQDAFAKLASSSRSRHRAGHFRGAVA